MPKTIVILVDGTSNSISEARSNVLRRYGCPAKTPGQRVYPIQGSGRWARPATRSRAIRPIGRVAAGAGLTREGGT